MRKAIGAGLPWLLLFFSAWLVFSQVARPALLLRVFVPWAGIGSMAVVMTAIILTGGIDLSVGSVASLSSIVMGVLWHDAGWPIAPACGAGLATGIVAGGINASLVVVGLSPLVTTLATMAFFRGLAMTISGTERVTGFPVEFLELKSFSGVSAQFWLLLLVVAAGIVIVNKTKYGRWCFAIGDNRTAARFAGVPDRRVDAGLYVASGAVASLVAILSVMQNDVAFPDSFRGDELKVIACVVVGGTLITGGQGSIYRTLLGLAVVSLLDIGLTFLSTRLNWVTAESRLIITGVLVIAIAIWNQRITACHN